MSTLNKLASGYTQCTQEQNALYHDLCMAILRKDVRDVRVALEAGADPNLRPDLVSPLMLAVKDQSRRIIDSLTFVGADFNEVTDVEHLKNLGPDHPGVQRVLAMRADEREMPETELKQEYEIDLNLKIHLHNRNALRPQNTGLVVSKHDGLLEAKNIYFPERSPPTNRGK